MNINLTLIVQMIVFGLLVWAVMKWLWPVILDAMDARQRKIAQGLAAAEEGERELNELIEQSKGTASSEGARIIAAAHQQIELDTARATEGLRREVAGIAVGAAAKLLDREIDSRTHADLLDKLAAQI